MDDDLRQDLFDPSTARALVLARRPPARSAVTCVVSDVVWGDVVRLLRWATASTGGAAGLEAGTWWRLAASCADLLRRLPGLSAELGEAWELTGALDDDLPGESGAARVQRVAGRLAAALHSSEPLPLRRLAAEVDALGAAAIRALAERSSWAVPSRP
ncbi:MAG TPA: hypothetical protein VHF92_07720 [Geodermatophilus sp.]|nr:hypothetical protein [Geodermatophilus sp.]